MDELSDASPDAVLREIQSRVHRFDWFKAYCVVVGTLAVLGLPLPPVSLVVLALGCVPAYFIYHWNRDRRTARLIYDLDDDELVYRASVCNAAGEALSKPVRLWHIYSSLGTSDWKRNAGASALIRRTDTVCRQGSLPGIELNIEPWSIAVGPQHILFLPDRLLVHENGRFAALSYEDLVAGYEVTRFIEEDTVPRDARQVDTTWRFVNKAGGPDRRFNNNTQLPVMEYGRLTLRSPHGMTVVIESSDPGTTLRASQALEHLHEMASRSRRDDAHEPSIGASLPADPEPAPAPQLLTVSARDLALVLRYIAAADRKFSDAETSYIAQALAASGAPANDVQLVMKDFKSLRADHAEVQRALQALTRSAPDVASKVIPLVEALAAVDGRVTPKERERLDEVAAWIRTSACPPPLRSTPPPPLPRSRTSAPR